VLAAHACSTTAALTTVALMQGTVIALRLIAHLVGCACAIGEMQHRLSVDDKGSGLLKDK